MLSGTIEISFSSFVSSLQASSWFDEKELADRFVRCNAGAAKQVGAEISAIIQAYDCQRPWMKSQSCFELFKSCFKPLKKGNNEAKISTIYQSCIKKIFS